MATHTTLTTTGRTLALREDPHRDGIWLGFAVADHQPYNLTNCESGNVADCVPHHFADDKSD